MSQKTSDELIYEALRGEISRNDRVCLMPMHWSEFYKILKRRANALQVAAPAWPLILAAWGSSDWEKAKRMSEHVEWAIRFGCAAEALEDLRARKGNEWLFSTSSQQNRAAKDDPDVDG